MTADRNIPAPVKAALNVLAGLEQERAEKLRRALPAYAMTLARQGRKVTEQVLHDALAKGDNTVMGPRPAFTKAAETIEQRYNRIVDKWPKPEGMYTKDNPYLSLNSRLMRAAGRGDLAMIQDFVGQGANIHQDNETALCRAARNGHLEVVKYLVDCGADIQARDNLALCNAARSGHLAIVEYLIDHSANIQANGNYTLYWAALSKNFNVVRYLIDHGANMAVTEQAKKKEIKSAFKDMDTWMKKTGAYPPTGLESKAPGSFDPAAVNTLGLLISKEGYDKWEANRYAYQAIRLFGTAEKAMDYFEKWAKRGEQPLHDVVQMISVPDKTSDLKSWAATLVQKMFITKPAPDLKSWAAAVMEHGPEMAKLVKFADKLPQPVRSADGKGWSLTKTKNEVAKFAYPKAGRNHELATLFNKHSKTEDSFNTALKIVKKHKGKKHSHIPNITIDGEKFDLPKAVFKKLPDGDYRGLVLGELTACCQSIGGAGEDCAEHGFTSENGGFYIVAVNDNKKGNEEIIGQSWAWRGKEGELVLDSLETLGDRVKPEQWTKLAQAFAKALEKTDITALHIGKGGDTPRNMPFETAAAQPVDYDGYRDSERQYRVFRK